LTRLLSNRKVAQTEIDLGKPLMVLDIVYKFQMISLFKEQVKFLTGYQICISWKIKGDNSRMEKVFNIVIKVGLSFIIPDIL
jgi:hypothetical protein